LSQSDWSRRRRSCSALAPGGADIISVTCTAAFGVLIVARLSRDDFTQIAVQRVSISLSISVCTENLIRVDAVMESPKLAE
jgi:hypothetical protein